MKRFELFSDIVDAHTCKTICAKIDHELREYEFDDYEKTRFKHDRLRDIVSKRLHSETGFLESFGLSGDFSLRNSWTCHKYLQGHSLRTHVDGSRNGSILSVLVYLNDDFSGGETLFKQSYLSPIVEASIDPRQGSVLVLRQNAWHSAQPVLSGVKYIARTDLLLKTSS